MFWHSYILPRGFYFILNCSHPPEERHPHRFMVDEDINIAIFFAGLKTVVSMCHSYGTFSHITGCRTPIRQMPSGILFFKGLRPFCRIGIRQPIIGRYILPKEIP